LPLLLISIHQSIWVPVCGGGKGRDTLVLTTGVYQVVGDRISTADSFLPVAGINVLAGINGGSFAYRPGTLTVDETGVATFVADL
jgi:hypothetical protein